MILTIFLVVFNSSTASAALPLFYGDVLVEKGDYNFVKEDAKVWLYLDFTKAELVYYDAKSEKIKERKGNYLESKKEGEWEDDFEQLYFWTILAWNMVCDHENIPLHMTSEKDSAKYALELYVDNFDYGFPRIGLVAGEGATIDGRLIVRNLQTGETIYEAKVDRVKTWDTTAKEVWRMRATLFYAILNPHFLGINGYNAWLYGYDVRDNPDGMKFNPYNPKKDKAKRNDSNAQESKDKKEKKSKKNK